MKSPAAKSVVKAVLEPVIVSLSSVVVMVPDACVKPLALAPTSFHQVKLPAIPVCPL